MKNESSAADESSSQRDCDTFKDTKTCESVKELELTLEKKEKQLQEQVKATKEYKVCVC